MERASVAQVSKPAVSPISKSASSPNTNSLRARKLRYEELRREIVVGIEQADRGDLAPLNVRSIKNKVRNRLNALFD